MLQTIDRFLTFQVYTLLQKAKICKKRDCFTKMEFYNNKYFIFINKLNILLITLGYFFKYNSNNF